jgi:hypothetical protein
MIIWGGQRAELTYFPNSNTYYPVRKYIDSIGIYYPTLDAWITTPTINTPAGRYNHSAVWTGTDMIIKGGLIDEGSINDNSGVTTNTGARLLVN